MAETRRLAAILAADVVGFSRMTGADEDGTLSRLRVLRDDLVEPATAAHNGDFPPMFRRAAVFVDKFLKGEKPGEIPIEQATKFKTVVNLGTAKTLGLDIPPTVLASADEVIE